MTPAERMLELTSLTGLHTPAEHFLSITQIGGSGSFIASELEIEIMQLSIDINEEIEVEVGAQDVSIEIEEGIAIEVCE